MFHYQPTLLWTQYQIYWLLIETVDYIWHNDEIPYESKAKCRRGHSYYSNSVNANDTDIDVASDIESLLDYSNKGICYYCVCSMDGNAAGCLSRSPWFCEYFRFLRERNAMRDTYTTLFQKDKPMYFRSISWRLRRTMDTGMFDLLENGRVSLGFIVAPVLFFVYAFDSKMDRMVVFYKC